MNKLIVSTLIALLPLSAMAKDKQYEEATKACEAFNNMKHTSNSNNISLTVGKKYRVLQENRGQILTLIDGERIAQRWVDKSCFGNRQSEEKKSSNLSSILTSIKNRGTVKQIDKSTSKKNLLALSWQNAFCQTHQYKKECKNMTAKDFGAFEFVLHGLWPQPRNNQYCNVDKKQIGMDKNKQWYSLNRLDLRPEVRSELSKVMPGYSSNLHKHEWIKHGTCYGKNASDYYSDAINLLKQINSSKVGEFFKQNIGKTVRLEDIRKVFNREFGTGTGRHVTMNCQRGLITELWLHLGNRGKNISELLRDGETPNRTCYKGRIDAVGF